LRKILAREATLKTSGMPTENSGGFDEIEYLDD
jgi:hypothetical protein